MFRRYKLKLRVEPCGVFFCIHIGKKVNAKQHVYWPYAQIKKWLYLKKKEKEMALFIPLWWIGGALRFRPYHSSYGLP